MKRSHNRPSIGKSSTKLSATQEKMSESRSRGQNFSEFCYRDLKITITNAAFSLFLFFLLKVLGFLNIAGLIAARARGRVGGRPKGPKSAIKKKLAQELYRDHTKSIEEICQAIGVSRATFYRYAQGNK